MSGVKGLFGAKVPPGITSCSLHALGSPWPEFEHVDFERPNRLRKAIPVGIFSPEAKTDTLKPAGTLMPWPVPGLNCAELPLQPGFGFGFVTVVAWAATGIIEARTPADT